MSNKISKLLEYKHYLETNMQKDALIKVSDCMRQGIKEISEMYSDVSDDNNIMRLNAAISVQQNMVTNALRTEILRVNTKIFCMESTYIELSDSMYEGNFKKDNYQTKSTIRLLDPEYKEFLKGLLVKYIDFRYACMELGPLYPDVTDLLTGFDPIYLVDHDPAMLDHALTSFDEKYRHKLLTYTSNIREEIVDLPKNSMGFILSINSLDRYNNTALESALRNFHNMLLPGGSIMFTMNNCDFPEGCREVENGRACYQVTKFMDQLLERLGYICIKFSVYNKNLTVVEAQKQGELPAVKMTSCIGQIIDARRLETDERNAYNRLLKEKRDDL